MKPLAGSSLTKAREGFAESLRKGNSLKDLTDNQLRALVADAVEELESRSEVRVFGALRVHARRLLA